MTLGPEMSSFYFVILGELAHLSGRFTVRPFQEPNEKTQMSLN